MASTEASTTTIRIPIALKKELDELKHPGQSYHGFIKELLMTAYGVGVIAKQIIAPTNRRERERKR